MSKALWFWIAILLYCALATEALTCIKCKKTEVGRNCVSRVGSKTCIAHPGQQCQITKFTSDAGVKTIYSQGCPMHDAGCDMTMEVYEVGFWEWTCCNNRNLCNIP